MLDRRPTLHCSSACRSWLAGAIALMLALAAFPALGAPLGDCSSEIGLEQRTDVVFCEPWESDDWYTHGFTNDGSKSDPRPATAENVSFTTIVASPCVHGSCLELTMARGATRALALHWPFANAGLAPEQAYLRYYLRIASGWNADECDETGAIDGDGGKLAGLADVRTNADASGQCGNGGDRSDGINCWSVRGGYRGCNGNCEDSGGVMRIGSYAYFSGQEDFTGSMGLWDDNPKSQSSGDGGSCSETPNNLACGVGKGGQLLPERWYRVETFVKMNTPGVADGVLRGWIDGALSFEKTNVKYRESGHDDLHVRTAWLDIYKGGVLGNCVDSKVFVDQMVLSVDAQVGGLDEGSTGNGGQGGGAGMPPDAVGGADAGGAVGGANAASGTKNEAGGAATSGAGNGGGRAAGTAGTPPQSRDRSSSGAGCSVAAAKTSGERTGRETLIALAAAAIVLSRRRRRAAVAVGFIATLCGCGEDSKEVQPMGGAGARPTTGGAQGAGARPSSGAGGAAEPSGGGLPGGAQSDGAGRSTGGSSDGGAGGATSGGLGGGASTEGGGVLCASVGWCEITNTRLQDVCPARGTNQPASTQDYEFPSFCKSVTGAWSGGIADLDRRRMIVWGGGHGDYYGNELYALDLDDLVMRRLNDPSPINDDNASCPKQLADGRPNSRHSYSGLSYLQHADRMFAFGGSMACGAGDAGGDTWTLDLETLEWTRMDPVAGGKPVDNLVAVSDYDPTSKLVYLVDRSTLWSYDYGSNAYTALADAPIGLYHSGAIDPKRHLLVMIGTESDESPALKVIDLASGSNHELEDLASQASGCAQMFVRNPGIAYDPVYDRMVVWAGGDTVVLYDPDSVSCTTLSFGGGPGPQVTTGTYGRWRYFADPGVFALVNHVADDAYTLRLPAP